MLRRTIFNVLVIVSFCVFFTAPEAKGQTVYGITAVEYDQSQQRIYAYSATETDYYASYYYDAYVEGYIYDENFNVLDSGSDLAYILAEVYTTASTSPGHTYYIISDHYVGAYYYEDYGYYQNYFDPYGFSFADGGRYGSTYGFLPGPSTYRTYRLYHLGTTGIELYLYGEPRIDQMVPTTAPLDSSIEVNFSGVNFGPSPSINVGGSGVSVSSITYVTDTRITAIFDIAANASTGNHSVSVSARGYTSNSVNLQVGNQTPQITGLEPSRGMAGDVVGVTISGRGFGSAPTVSVSGGINVQITSRADQQITANFSIPSTTPSGDYTVRVTSNGVSGSGFISTGGSSPTSNGVPFTVQAQPPPHISAYSPQAASLDTSIEINVQGENFGTNPTLQIGGRGVTVRSYANVADRDHQIIAILDIAADAETGNHPISVSTRGQTSNSVNFQVGDRSPQITQITPSSGTRGTTFQVVVKGSGFGSSPTLAVSGTGVNVTLGTVSDTQINATFSISSLAELLRRTVTVTSRGVAGNGFVQPPGGGQNTATVPFDINTVKVKIDTIDKRFAPSAENLNLTYSITPAGVQVPSAKLEIFKKGDPTTPIFRDTGIPRGSTGPNPYSWDGKANEGADSGKYIGPENSPYVLRITIATDNSFGTTNRPVEKEFKVEIDSVETTPTSNSEYRIIKPPPPNPMPNPSPTPEIETEIRMVVKLKNKLGNGVQTTLPFKFHWSYIDPDDTSGEAGIDINGNVGDDNAPFEKGGKRKASTTPPAVIPIMWKQVTGFTTTVDAATGQTAVSEISTAAGADSGATKLIFLSSNIGGDNYKLKVEVKNDAGTLIKEVLFDKWSVRKALTFNNLFRMTDGVDIRTAASNDNVRPAYQGDGYTDYTIGRNVTTLTPAQSPEFIGDVLIPNAAETPSPPELTAYAANNAAARTAITNKARAWYIRNRQNIDARLRAIYGAAGAPAHSLFGARYSHPKQDGNPATGASNYYPAGIQFLDNNNILRDPNGEWASVQGSEIDDRSFVFLNSSGARVIVVCRHEIGHASDHVFFHVAVVNQGDFDHALSGLMHKTADQSPANNHIGVGTFSDDSILRLRGWRR